MGNRYADDIKRIVGIDPNQSILDAALQKAAIAARRGIGYFNPTTGGSESISGTPNQTQLPATKGIGDSKTGANTAGEEGLDPADPQNGVINTTTGQASAEDVIDGINAAAKLSHPQVTAAGLTYSNNNSLNSLTAVDCNTGDAVEIRLRNDFIPPDATLDSNGEELAAQWEDAGTPPNKVGWTSGVEWFTGNESFATFYPTTTELIDAKIASFLDAAAGSVTGQYWVTGNYTDGGLYHVDFSGDPSLTEFATSSRACTPGSGTSCPISAPTETQWPVDDKYVLKLDGGQFVSSEFDTEVPTNLKNASSKVNFCFGAGGSRTGTIETTKDNGHMIYETSGGAPTGIIRAYDSSGNLVAAFDNQSGWIDSYRP